MSNRRNFIKTAAVGSVALALNSFTSKEKNLVKPKSDINKPIVISTWNFGVQANGAAWEILKNNGRALDAVEAGVKVPEADPKETIHPDLLTPEIAVDAEINLADINEKLIRILNQFEPFGPQNMTPVFMSKGLKDSGYAKGIGVDEAHLKLFVKQSRSFGSSQGFGAIGFGLGKKLDLVKNQNPFEAVYCIDENEFNGNVTVQLRLKDLR